jgi:hypothetical protein
MEEHITIFSQLVRDFTNLGLPLANVHAFYVGKHSISHRTAQHLNSR